MNSLMKEFKMWNDYVTSQLYKNGSAPFNIILDEVHIVVKHS